MAGSPQHVTLAAGTVTTLTFDEDFAQVEVLNVDGAAAVYFRADGLNPTVGGVGSHVIPAVIGGLIVPPKTTGNTVVKLISAGTPQVSVRGLP
ncbi:MULTISPECIES: hypothetical protein [unclassified Micromonospora]|uniref:hypothetical protein n=1 Tax=unclassified Micromonospora TaxID=2617518 RepID=UPI00331C3D35